MIKRYKILISIIVFVLLGIITVMIIWLVGIYKNKQEAVISEVERSLFNAVQTYYKRNLDFEENDFKRGRTNKTYLSIVKREYPNVDTERLQSIWDSLQNDRGWFNHKGRDRTKPAGEPREIIPPFMMQHLNMNKAALQEIDVILDSLLNRKELVATTVLDLVEVDLSKENHRRHEFIEGGKIRTRPVVVNPQRSQFITATMSDYFFNILGKMTFQLVMSSILVLALIGSFGYLLLTIVKQNKMAVVRKSFVNNMTHELKTPVATVMAAVEAIERYGAKEDKVKMNKYLRMSHRELGHLSNMIDRVLQLDMDEVSGMLLDKINFDLTTLIEQCIESAKISSTKIVHISFEAIPKQLSFYGDPSHIKNVITNLLDNAIKYSGESVHIEIRLRDENVNVFFEIIDQGLGIEQKYLNDIFDMFFRVPSGHLHPVKGFGLGLSYVKQIITKHGGRISVRSLIHQGTTFTIILPKL